jgi:hypothetical protein
MVALRKRKEKCNPDDMRAEYTALSNYFQTVVSFRFTVIGFYIAFLGLIISQYKDISQSVNHYFIFSIFIVVTLVVWIIDLRSRVLYRGIGHRGKEIEKYKWRLSENKNSHPYYLHMMGGLEEGGDTKRLISEKEGKFENPDSINFLGFQFLFPKFTKRLLSYSFAIDLLLFGVFSISVCMILEEATPRKSDAIFVGFVFILCILALIWASIRIPES